jgi:hypothetical protein
MARRRPTAAQLRDHRSKQLALVLGVIFIAVAAIQMPRLMKQLNPPNPAENAGTGLVAAAHSGSATGSSDLPAGAATQLDNFSQLPLKDPFHPLVKTATASSTTTPPATTTAATTTTATPTPKPKAAAPSVKPAAPTPFISPPPNPPNAALIEMNGQRQIVDIGEPFPAGAPLFKLIALDKKSIEIGVFAGSFSSGDPTLAVKKGHKITLVNQFDGTHYVLKLVGLTVAPATATQPAGTTTTATATATTTPTVTTTTSP